MLEEVRADLAFKTAIGDGRSLEGEQVVHHRRTCQRPDLHADTRTETDKRIVDQFAERSRRLRIVLIRPHKSHARRIGNDVVLNHHTRNQTIRIELWEVDHRTGVRHVAVGFARTGLHIDATSQRITNKVGFDDKRPLRPFTVAIGEQTRTALQDLNVIDEGFVESRRTRTVFGVQPRESAISGAKRHLNDAIGDLAGTKILVERGASRISRHISQPLGHPVDQETHAIRFGLGANAVSEPQIPRRSVATG